MKAIKKTSQRGFTLMELLLAATILTVVISSSYSIFWMGLQIWKFSRGRGNVENKAVLAFEKIGRDFRSAIRISDENRKFRGSGTRTEIRIPAFIPSAPGRSDGGQFGLIVYRWESGSHKLCRQEMTASDIFRRNQPPCIDIAGSIQDFQMKYLIYEGVGEAYSWFDSWDEKDMTPLAVEITADLESLLKGEKTGSSRRYHKVVFIPVGEKIIEIEKTETETPSPETKTEGAEAA